MCVEVFEAQAGGETGLLGSGEAELKFDSSLFSLFEGREDTHKKNWRPKAPSSEKKKENLALALPKREKILKRKRELARSRTQRRVSLSLCLSVEALVLSPFCIYIYT
jgi:hypothetical protein